MSPRRICVVSCTAHKREMPLRAESLYCSELFYRSRRYAQANYDAWFILSAKHGLVSPCEPLTPYDCSLTALTIAERKALAERVLRQAVTKLDYVDTQVTSICGEEYDVLLEDAGIAFDRRPEFKLPIGMKLQALGATTDPNYTQPLLDATYKTIARLANKVGFRRLKDVLNDTVPDAGVYLFFDERERRLKDLNRLRIVRVGTHGVALGSKASLRDRLRTHFGTVSGDGNHRSSIFRLHTGRSLINAKLMPALDSWGEVVTRDKNILNSERELEHAVSKYIGELYVLLIRVPGISSKNNDRAYLEQNLIALLSNTRKPLDPPSCEWLGLSSAKPEIRKSGLWNVNHIDQRVDANYLDVLSYYVSLTLGSKPTPKAGLAPSDWQARVRGDERQLSLL
jgi:hypothetical protein